MEGINEVLMQAHTAAKMPRPNSVLSKAFLVAGSWSPIITLMATVARATSKNASQPGARSKVRWETTFNKVAEGGVGNYILPTKIEKSLCRCGFQHLAFPI